jgi:hypothetical protein
MLAGPGLTVPSGKLASGAGRLGGMTGPGRETSAMTLPDRTDAYAALDALAAKLPAEFDLTPLARLVFRAAFDRDPSSVARAEIPLTRWRMLRAPIARAALDSGRVDRARGAGVLGAAAALGLALCDELHVLAWIAFWLRARHDHELGDVATEALRLFGADRLVPRAEEATPLRLTLWCEGALRPGGELRSPDRAALAAFVHSMALVIDEEQACHGEDEGACWEPKALVGSGGEPPPPTPAPEPTAQRERLVIERLRAGRGGPVSENALNKALKAAGFAPRVRGVIDRLREKGWNIPAAEPGSGLGFRLVE